MGDSVEEKRKKRLQYMRAAYEHVQGSSRAPFSVLEIGEKLGFGIEETFEIAAYLRGKGLLKSIGNGVFVVTHDGVVEMENAISKPETPTKHFPAVNLIYVHNMSQSQIQQGTVASTQNVTFTANDVQAVREWLKEYKERLPELKLSATDHQDAEAQIATVEAQLSASQPDSYIVKRGCEMLKGFLAHIAGSMAADFLLNHFPHFLK